MSKYKEKTYNSVKMIRNTELKKGFLDKMQNKVLGQVKGDKILGSYCSMRKEMERI